MNALAVQMVATALPRPPRGFKGVTDPSQDHFWSWTGSFLSGAKAERAWLSRR